MSAGRQASASAPRGGRGGARRAAAAAAFAACCLTLLAGCGAARQDAHEPQASFQMEVVRASFPAKQAVARPATMVLRVRNSGSSTVPVVAVSVDSFNYVSRYPELAARIRPVWAIEQGPGALAKPPVESQEVIQPGSGQTAYVNTWALGPLAAGQSRTFSWRVTPVQPGPHVVHYTVAAGLSGHARARAASGAPVRGAFVVRVAPAPPKTYVDPATGRVVAGTLPPKTP